MWLIGSFAGPGPGGIGSLFIFDSELDATASRSLASESAFSSGFPLDTVNAPAAAAATPPDVFDVELDVCLFTGGESMGDLSSACLFGLLCLAYVRE